MEDAMWLFWDAPKWFFWGAIGFLQEREALTSIPFAGTAGLVTALVIGVWKRTAGLLFFVIPFLLSQGFVAATGYYRGEMAGGSADPVTYGFLGLQILITVIIALKVRRPVLAVIGLTVFSLTYALFAGMIGAMALQESWL